MAKQKRNRSPNYPVVSLKSGLDYLERLHGFSNGRHLVPMQSAIAIQMGLVSPVECPECEGSGETQDNED